ncbi:MAG: hypothetical protein U0L18_09075 [Acutalibacteraceae bacterium]|nr:hypothetical protein [Acutalibacteraceae bacterium]
MNLAEIVQSILTYFCTAGFVAACGYAAALSKRITILEQRVEFSDKCYSQTSEQIEKILNVVTEISTRLTRLEVKIEGNN